MINRNTCIQSDVARIRSGVTGTSRSGLMMLLCPRLAQGNRDSNCSLLCRSFLHTVCSPTVGVSFSPNSLSCRRMAIVTQFIHDARRQIMKWHTSTQQAHWQAAPGSVSTVAAGEPGTRRSQWTAFRWMSCERPRRALAKLFASLETPAMGVTARPSEAGSAPAGAELSQALPLALPLQNGTRDASAALPSPSKG